MKKKARDMSKLHEGMRVYNAEEAREYYDGR
jgi:hypothetical protein